MPTTSDPRAPARSADGRLLAGEPGIEAATTMIDGATHNDLTPESEQAFVDLGING